MSVMPTGVLKEGAAELAVSSGQGAARTLHSKLVKLESIVHSYKFGALSQFSEKFRQFCTLVSPKIKET